MTKVFQACLLILACAGCANQRQHVGTSNAPAKAVASCIHVQMERQYPNKIGFEEFEGGQQYRIMYNLNSPTSSTRVMHVIVSQTTGGAVVEVEAYDAWKLSSVQRLLGPCIDVSAVSRS